VAFLKTSILSEPAHILRRGGIVLRPPQLSDYAAWSELRRTSETHLAPFEPAWGPDDLTRFAFRRRLRQYQREIASDQTYPFLLFRAGDGALLGGVTLGNVRRGVAQTASLGYWLGAEHVGQGHMTKAVAAVLAFAFDDLHLHRIEAACLPANRASIAVLLRNGFREEGVARKCLRIAGRWQDHVTFAILAEDRTAGREAP
jgi:ribosomal-protein-alanine N-acetyltransferase